MALYPSPVTLPSSATIPGGGSPATTAYTPPTDQPWATADDVRSLLGQLPLPAGVSIDAHLIRAHAIAVGWLTVVYSDRVPTFSGAALNLVTTAEAGLAAASVMSALLVRQEGADYTAVNTWRADAKATLQSPIPGYPLGKIDPDGDGPLIAVETAPVSVFSRGPYVDDYDGSAYVNSATGQLATGLWG